jgi:hypothetical protein
LGELPFPRRAVMLVNVSSRETPMLNMFTPPVGKRVGPCHMFTFYIPGLDFNLYVGQRIPVECYRDCAYHSPEKLVGFMDNDELFVKPILDLLRTSKPMGKLKRSFPAS